MKKKQKRKKAKVIQTWQSSLDEPVEQWYHKNLDIQNRVIYFGAWQPSEEVGEVADWEVNDWSAQNIIKGLYLLNKLSQDPITIIWFSYGGDWNAGMAIYDFIKHVKSPVTIKAYGRIRSMGTIILQACAKRFLSPHCEFLIHYGAAAMDEKHAKDFERYAENLKKSNETMEKIYLKRIKEKHPRFTLVNLQNNYLKYDKYLTSKQAVELGLADGIIT